MRVSPRLFAATVTLLWAALPAGSQQPAAPVLLPGTPHLARPFPAPDKFTFAVLGDRTGGGIENWPITDRAVAELNLLRPDFVLSTGDLQRGYTDDMAELNHQWREYNAHLSRLAMPYFFVPGNHDIYSRDSYDLWKKNAGRTYYSFDYKGCHFLVLNTHEMRGSGAKGAREPMGWARLRSPGPKPTWPNSKTRGTCLCSSTTRSFAPRVPRSKNGWSSTRRSQTSRPPFSPDTFTP